MAVREDRLWAENESMKKFRSQVLTWKTSDDNDIPDHYLLHYDLKSIIGFNDNGKPKYHKGFDVEIHFKSDYPRTAPAVHVKGNPIPMHPNIYRDTRICLEGTQMWIPGIGVPLDSLCLMIGQIIAYQEVNLGSMAHANNIMTAWVNENLKFESKTTKVLNPVDPSQIRLTDVDDAIRWGTTSQKPESRILFG